MGRFGRFDISISRGRCPCGQKVANMSTDMKIETFHEAIFAHFAQQMYANLAQPWWRAQTWCKSVLRSVAASPDITPS